MCLEVAGVDDGIVLVVIGIIRGEQVLVPNLGQIDLPSSLEIALARNGGQREYLLVVGNLNGVQVHTQSRPLPLLGHELPFLLLELLLLPQFALAELLNFLLDLILLRFGSHLAIVRVVRRRGAIVAIAAAILSGVVLGLDGIDHAQPPSEQSLEIGLVEDLEVGNAGLDLGRRLGMIQIELAVARRTIVLLLLFAILFRLRLVLTQMARKAQAGAHAEHRHGILGQRGRTGMGAGIAGFSLDEIGNRPNRPHRGVHQRHIVPLPAPGLLPVLLVEDVHLPGAGGGHGAGIPASGGRPVDLLEHMFGIEHAGIDAVGFQIVLTHQKDLG